MPKNPPVSAARAARPVLVRTGSVMAGVSAPTWTRSATHAHVAVAHASATTSSRDAAVATTSGVRATGWRSSANVARLVRDCSMSSATALGATRTSCAIGSAWKAASSWSRSITSDPLGQAVPRRASQATTGADWSTTTGSIPAWSPATVPVWPGWSPSMNEVRTYSAPATRAIAATTASAVLTTGGSRLGGPPA